MASDDDEPIVRMEGVEKAFGDVPVLRGLDLSVRRGETVAVIGTSGSGKSTVLRLLMALDAPDAGRILLGGMDLWTRPDGKPADEAHLRKAREKLGMVFQHFNLFPHLSALRNVSLGPELVKGLKRREAESVAGRWLERVGLADKAEAHPAELSGGQKQRVGIARALVMEPEILLLDEITSGLDPELVDGVLELVHELAEQQSITMLVVTHRMAFAREAADRVVFLDAGRVLEQGPPDQIFEAPTEERTREFLHLTR
ncbi:MAG TPA: amino acid ABC transporter ATP-binding protein [Sandaracinaceae bacterium LLY-WYZ-13_1]|nr:amino acid ABC transporter ATP-binding protein [Sandaracinaceae bacterium LLY-WYZ-13_1]